MMPRKLAITIDKAKTTPTAAPASRRASSTRPSSGGAAAASTLSIDASRSLNVYKLIGRHAALIVSISVSLAYLHVDVYAVDALLATRNDLQARADLLQLVDDVQTKKTCFLVL
jgi:hypothetical protein